MKLGLLGMGFLFAEALFGEPVKVESTLAWEVSQGMAQPESVFFDESTKQIFVSNVAGEPLNKDQKGWISVLSADGKVLHEKWYSELNAPKGMRVYKGLLWVSDIDRVLALDVKTAKLVKIIEIPSAKFLNDVAISKSGLVFVSDTAANKIYKIEGDKAEVFVEGSDWEAPNGLLVKEPYLFVAGWGAEVGADLSTKGPGSLYRIDLKSKKKSKVLDLLGHLDGLESAWPSLQGFLVSDWVAGKVYLTRKSAQPRALVLDGLEGAADIGVMVKDKMLLVPEMKSSKIKAFKLKDLR